MKCGSKRQHRQHRQQTKNHVWPSFVRCAIVIEFLGLNVWHGVIFLGRERRMARWRVTKRIRNRETWWTLTVMITIITIFRHIPSTDVVVISILCCRNSFLLYIIYSLPRNDFRFLIISIFLVDRAHHRTQGSSIFFPTIFLRLKNEYSREFFWFSNHY